MKKSICNPADTSTGGFCKESQWDEVAPYIWQDLADGKARVVSENSSCKVDLRISENIEILYNI